MSTRASKSGKAAKSGKAVKSGKIRAIDSDGDGDADVESKTVAPAVEKKTSRSSMIAFIDRNINKLVHAEYVHIRQIIFNSDAEPKTSEKTTGTEIRYKDMSTVVLKAIYKYVNDLVNKKNELLDGMVNM